MIHQEQTEEEDGSLDGGGAQFNFASLLKEQEKKDEERRQKLDVNVQDFMQLDDKITTKDLHNQINEAKRDLTDTNKNLMIADRRA